VFVRVAVVLETQHLQGFRLLLEPALKKNQAKIVAAILSIYFIFLLNLGTRTFAQHVLRIATTPESRALTYEVFATARGAAEAVMNRARGAAAGFDDAWRPTSH
jgi:hypothetical protein